MKIILVTRIRESDSGGFRNPFERRQKSKYIAEKYISLDGGKTFEDLPNFPTDSRIENIKKQPWYDQIGEFVAMGDNYAEVVRDMQPNDKTNMIYRVWNNTDTSINATEKPYPTL